MPPYLRFLRPNQTLLAVLAFVAAACLSALIAWVGALVIESRSAAAVTSRLLNEGYTWASVETDGLQVRLLGTAPNESLRFRAVNLAGSVVESSRIRDEFEVTPARAFEAPIFSVEILRNDDGIQLIGLLPEGGDRANVASRARAISPEIELVDMLETAAYPATDQWNAALAFGLTALEELPRSKISVSAEKVTITAIAASEDEKRMLEADLARSRPANVSVEVNISAPRPVLTPFTLRFILDAEGARFDACSADTEAARDMILAAARAAGLQGKAECPIGLGVPSPSWAKATSAGIAAVGEMGAGTLTFSDADVTLLVPSSVARADYDRVVGELESTLPDVFSLDASLDKPADPATQGPTEFTATRSPDKGKVELRGRLADEVQRAAVESFAQAQFGAGKVYVATLLDPELPDGWPVRVLAGLEALAQLDSGTLIVRPDTVEVEGITGSKTAQARIAQILSDKLGQGQTFTVKARYDEALDPIASIPTPEECVARANAVLEKKKITFAPGSAEIDSSAGPVMEALTVALKDCAAAPIEIGGHTDSQGSDGGNLALSQARSEAVLVALQGRRVEVSNFTAKGYGETEPVADNETEVGREANRRIAFTLRPAPGSPEALAKAEAEAPSLAPQDMTLRPKPRPATDN